MARSKKTPNNNAAAASSKKSTVTTTAIAKKKSKTTSSKKPAFTTYIHRVLKQTHPNLGISQTGMRVMNDFVLDMFNKLATEAKNDLQLNQVRGGGRSRTLLPKHFMTATKIVLPGELAKHASGEGSKAVLMHKTWRANSGGKK